MRAWISDTYADEEGGVTDGRSVILRGTKAEVMALASFMASVAKHLESEDSCHMHLQDHMAAWKKGSHIDIEVTAENEAD